MNKAEEVIKRLREETKTYRIEILGDSINKKNGFTILMLCQPFGSIHKDEYGNINKKTIDLLKEAEIEFKIIE